MRVLEHSRGAANAVYAKVDSEAPIWPAEDFIFTGTRNLINWEGADEACQVRDNRYDSTSSQ